MNEHALRCPGAIILHYCGNTVNGVVIELKPEVEHRRELYRLLRIDRAPFVSSGVFLFRGNVYEGSTLRLVMLRVCRRATILTIRKNTHRW